MRCSNTRLISKSSYEKFPPRLGATKEALSETPFAVTVFYLLTVTNNAGRLAPITNAELPAPFTSPMSWSEGQCLIMRGKMAQPEKYVCQVFRSAPSTSWTYVPPGSVMPSEVSPSAGRAAGQA